MILTTKGHRNDRHHRTRPPRLLGNRSERGEVMATQVQVRKQGTKAPLESQDRRTPSGKELKF